MAIGCHVVRTSFVAVDTNGVRIDKNNTTIKTMMSANTEHRIIPDAAIASSTGWPTVKAYIEAEAALGYILAYLDQTTIVTYSATDINAS